MGMYILLLQAGASVEAPTERDAAAYRGPGPATATNLGTAFSNVANARAFHAAIATKAGNFSYSSVLRAAHHVRNYLCARPGYVSGARVALQISNSPEYLAAFYGTLLADCVVVPLPVSLEEQRQQKIVELCQPDVLISRAEDFNSRGHEAPVATLTLSESSDSAISFSAPHRQQTDLAMLLLRPDHPACRKIMLSHRNLLANAAFHFARAADFRGRSNIGSPALLSRVRQFHFANPYFVGCHPHHRQGFDVPYRDC